jgi:hypothetical protein
LRKDKSEYQNITFLKVTFHMNPINGEPLNKYEEAHVGSTLDLSDKTQKKPKSRKPNGNSKRFKKRKAVESNDEINEKGQQTGGTTLSTKNCGNFQI